MEILSDGVIRVQVAEAEVHNINIRFLDRKTYVLSSYFVESILKCFVGHWLWKGSRLKDRWFTF